MTEPPDSGRLGSETASIAHGELYGAVPLCMAAGIAVLAVPGCTGSTGRVAHSELRDLSNREQVIVDRGTEILVQRCMERKGFRYWTEPVASAAARAGQGYVLHDVGWARKYGYGTRLDAEVVRAGFHDRNDAYARTLAKPDLVRYNTALEGTPSRGMVTVHLPTGGTVMTTRDGCQAEAESRLYGDAAKWFRARKIAENVTGLYAPDILKDKRFKAALRKWAACMRRAGHPYSSPSEIRRELPLLTKHRSPADAHATEVRTAVAEAECANSTPLYRTARALEAEYRNRKLGRYRDDITTYQRMNLTALDRAKPLVSTAR
jgi:hypothetical protein